MSSNLIQKSLIDIEQNLKKLESARSQVGNMADKSEQLITSVASVIESIEEIKNSFSNEENYLKNSVHDSLEEFSQTLSKGAESANKKASKITLKQEEVVNRTITKMVEFQDNLSKVQKSILDFNLEKSLDKITSKISDISHLISSNKITINQEILDLKSQIQNTKKISEKSANKITGEIDKISELSISNQKTTNQEILDLNSQIESLKMLNEKSTKINLILSITVGIIIIIVIVLFK